MRRASKLRQWLISTALASSSPCTHASAEGKLPAPAPAPSAELPGQVFVPGAARSAQPAVPKLSTTENPDELNISAKAGRATSDLEPSRERFRLGTQLAAEGRWTEALRAYREAFQLFPHPTTLYNIGVCQKRLGKFTQSWQSTQRALLGAEFPADRKLATTHVEQAKRQLAELRWHFGSVRLDTPFKLQVQVDGRPLVTSSSQPHGPFLPLDELAPSEGSAAPVNSDVTIWVNPGNHTITLKNETQEHTQQISVDAGESFALRWVQTHTNSAAVEPPKSSPPTVAKGVREPAEPQGLSVRRWTLAAAWAGAGVGLATASVGGAIALRLHSKLEAQCSRGTCPKDSASRVESYRSAIRWTNAGLWSAAVASGLGLSLYWLTDEDTVQVAPGEIQFTHRF